MRGEEKQTFCSVHAPLPELEDTLPPSKSAQFRADALPACAQTGPLLPTPS